MSLSDVFTTLSGLAVIGGGVLLLATFARDPKADEHDLSDFHPDVMEWKLRLRPVPPGGTNWKIPEDVAVAAAAEMRELNKPKDILPPAPPGMNAGSPLYAGMLFDTWHPESPADTADRFLRELRDEALAGAR